MTEVARFDRGQLTERMDMTPEGWLRGTAKVTRTGVLEYLNADGTVRRELRHPDEVFAADSLASLKLIPVVNDHPAVRLLTKDNAALYTVGSTGDTVAITDSKYVSTSLVITGAAAIEAVKKGKRELSLGYTATLVPEVGNYDGMPYEFRQTGIRYNHLAIVDRARVGSAARLNLDAADAVEVQPLEKKAMPKITLDGIDYEAAQEVINALTRARQDAQEAKSSVATLTKDAEVLKAKLDSATTELKAEKEKDHADSISKAVKARLAVLDAAAKAALPSEVTAKLDTMSDADIQRAVILAKQPDAKLDGRSSDYIAARFDAVVETLGDKTADARKKIIGNTTNTHNDSDKADLARKKMLDSMSGAWKRKENV